MKLLFLLTAFLLPAVTNVQKNADALMDAVKKGDTARIQRLVAEGADVNRADNFGWTSLMAAASIQQVAVARVLIADGANVNAASSNGKTPLMYAIDGRDRFGGGPYIAPPKATDLVELLLNKKADINASDKSGSTALMYAVITDNLPIVSLLLKWGADVARRNAYRRSALSLAYDLQIVQALLQKGADIKADGGDVLSHAARQGDLPMVRWLLHHGVNINAIDFQGETALMVAAGCIDTNLVSFLLSRGADANIQTKQDGSNALIMAASCSTPLMQETESSQNREHIINTLLDKGVDINARDIHGYTALIWAARNGDVNTVKLLLARGADVNIRSKNGETIIKLTRDTDSPGRFKVIQLLERAGARE